jgi:hypothetical protein
LLGPIISRCCWLTSLIQHVFENYELRTRLPLACPLVYVVVIPSFTGTAPYLYCTGIYLVYTVYTAVCLPVWIVQYKTFLFALPTTTRETKVNPRVEHSDEYTKISISKERVRTTDALLRCGMKGECGDRNIEDDGG